MRFGVRVVLEVVVVMLEVEASEFEEFEFTMMRMAFFR